MRTSSWTSETRTASRRTTAGWAFMLVRPAAATRLLAATAATFLFETTAQAHLHLRLRALWGTVSEISTATFDRRASSLAGLTYGLAGNHQVLRCRGLHRLLLLRWVDFRHFIRWDDNANSSCEPLLNEFVESNLVESLLNPISRKPNIASVSFLILPTVCSVLRVLRRTPLWPRHRCGVVDTLQLDHHLHGWSATWEITATLLTLAAEPHCTRLSGVARCNSPQTVVGTFS